MIRAEITAFGKQIEIAIFQKRADGTISAISSGDNLPWQIIPEGELIPRCLSLNNTEAQILMDDLWSCGLRPTEGKGSAGQLNAIQDHLSDMRKIVADRLKVQL